MSYENFEQHLLAFLDEWDITPDSTDMAVFRKIYDDWQAASPIEISEDPDNESVILRFKEEIEDRSQGDLLTLTFTIERDALINEVDTVQKTHSITLDKSGIRYKEEKPDSTLSESHKEYLDNALNRFRPAMGLRPEQPGDKINLETFLSQRACGTAITRLQNRLLHYFQATDNIPQSVLEDREQKKQFKTGLSGALTNAEQERRKTNVLKFAKHIDRDVLKIMHDVNNSSASMLNWLYGDGDEQLQTYRRQALQAYPFLSAVITSAEPSGLAALRDRFALIDAGNVPHNILFEQELGAKDPVAYYAYLLSEAFAGPEDMRVRSSTAKISELKEIIDQGKPLAPFLQVHKIGEYEPLSKRTLKSLGKIKRLPKEVEDLELLKALPYLNEVDPNWHPKNGQDLADFAECVKRASFFAEYTGKSKTDILKTTRGRWAAWLEKTVSRQEIEKIPDWLDETYNMFLAPALYTKAAEAGMHVPHSQLQEHWTGAVLDVSRKTLKKEFAAQYSPLELLDCARRFHEQRDTFEARKSALSEGRADALAIQCKWLPLSPPLTIGDYTIAPLTSKRELEEAGDKLNHCVGSYWTHCMKREDHIVGLYDQSGELTTTVHFREIKDTSGRVATLNRAQHQGKDGRDASMEEENVLQEYKKKLLSDPDYKPDWDAIEAVRAENRASEWRVGIAQKIGFDISENENRVAAYEAIQNYLPARLRYHEYESALEIAGFDQKTDAKITALQDYVAANPERFADREFYDIDPGILIGDEINRAPPRGLPHNFAQAAHGMQNAQQQMQEMQRRLRNEMMDDIEAEQRHPDQGNGHRDRDRNGGPG